MLYVSAQNKPPWEVYCNNLRISGDNESANTSCGSLSLISVLSSRQKKKSKICVVSFSFFFFFSERGLKLNWELVNFAKDGVDPHFCRTSPLAILMYSESHRRFCCSAFTVKICDAVDVLHWLAPEIMVTFREDNKLGFRRWSLLCCEDLVPVVQCEDKYEKSENGHDNSKKMETSKALDLSCQSLFLWLVSN